MPSKDEAHMAVALALARRGRGAVEPNPMVGAVIVRAGREIGRGFHARFGGPHAEIQAIADARAAGTDPRGATMFVTLEPCCHHGKTPPCTQAVIQAGLARVVVAMQDPDPNVAGRGLDALRRAGVEVVTGTGEHEARQLLAAYVKGRTTGRPWVICKWAQSLDGRIATRTGESRWISCEQSRRKVHELRGLCDGVCVGAGTVRADDPLLTNRSGGGRQPARVVLCGSGRLPQRCRLLETLDVSPVIVVVPEGVPAEALARAGAEVLSLPAGPGGVDLGGLLDELGRRQWTHLLVEGGRKVLGGFIGAGLADELLVFVAPRLLGCGGVGPVELADVEEIDRALSLPAPEVERVDTDLMLRYVLTDPGREEQP